MAVKETLILYSYPAFGHLVPMLELAKLFYVQDFDVVVLLTKTSSKVTYLIVGVSSKHPSITFHSIPPHPSVVDDQNESFFTKTEIMRFNNSYIKSFISDYSKKRIIRGIVLDFFCTDVLDVTEELGLPAYALFCCGAHDLAFFLQFPTLEKIDTNFKENNEKTIEFPGLPSIPANHLPNKVTDQDSNTYKRFVYHFERLTKVDRILINTAESLEPRAVLLLCNGLCTPGRPTPPVNCIGPLIFDEKNSEETEKHECLTWLDSQPQNSVVFLCFGSRGMFKAEQLKEIAEGLERSQQRFLWVVRAPPEDKNTSNFIDHSTVEPELESLLPNEFLDRTKNRGMVVKNWAPQRAVLAHEAVGGFLTHCGWNSILESINNGVPMIAWPLYAEQRMNKIFLVEEMELTVSVQGYDKELVFASEVEGKLRWLMISEEGKKLRERTNAAKRKAAEVKMAGGPSHRAFGRQ